MKTLVTGGSGFIGAAVVLELIKRGKPVRALVRSREKLGNLRGLDVELVEGDLLDRESLVRAVDGCSELYHLAGLYTNWLPNPQAIQRTNVDGTRNLLDVCFKCQVGRVVYTSSVAALGAHGNRQGGTGDESAQFNLAGTQDAYYLAKHEAEQVALEYFGKGLPVVIVNPTNPIGPRDIKPTPTGALMISILKRELPGYVEGGINIVDVNDVAVGHVLAMEKGTPGEKYILGNRNVSMHDYFHLIADAGGVRPPSLRIPLPIAIATAYGYEAVAKVTHRPPVTSASWVRVGSHYSYWDCSKAIRVLGMPQHPIEESLKNAVQWFRENGYA